MGTLSEDAYARKVLEDSGLPTEGIEASMREQLKIHPATLEKKGTQSPRAPQGRTR